MKYIFFGTPRFAEIVLASLLEAGVPPVAIVCNPDRPLGRKKIITPPPTKALAERSNAKGGHAPIEILQPEKIDTDFIERLKGLGADFAIVAAYAKILPKTVLEATRLGTLGTHPSLLPKFRGASPIQSTILAGEQETGTTIYLMDEKTDHGTILAQERLPNVDPGLTPYLALEEALAELSGATLAQVIPDFFAGKTSPQLQDESAATFTKKFTTQDGFIEPDDLAAAGRGDKEKSEEIFRKILALNPDPGVWTMKDEKRMKLLEAELLSGTLKLKTIQLEGERPKPAA